MPGKIVVEDGSGTHKLPIYSLPTPPLQVIETQTRLEQQVSEARKYLLSSTENLRNLVHDNVSRWIGVERRVERQVLEIIPQDEPLTPGLLYVGVATLAGSVFGRYRSLPIRLISPPLFLLGSLNYFLPKTAHNLSLYYQHLESNHLPSTIQQTRRSIQDTTSRLWRKSQESSHVVAQKVEGGWRGGLDKVQESTGLKVSPSSSGKVEGNGRGEGGGVEVLKVAPPGTLEARVA